MGLSIQEKTSFKSLMGRNSTNAGVLETEGEVERKKEQRNTILYNYSLKGTPIIKICGEYDFIIDRTDFIPASLHSYLHHIQLILPPPTMASSMSKKRPAATGSISWSSSSNTTAKKRFMNPPPLPPPPPSSTSLRRSHPRSSAAAARGSTPAAVQHDTATTTRRDNAVELESRISADDDLDHVIMAVDRREAGTIGCSYYSAQEEKLYLLGDIQSAGAEVTDSR